MQSWIINALQKVKKTRAEAKKSGAKEKRLNE